MMSDATTLAVGAAIVLGLLAIVGLFLAWVRISRDR
jgi:hypothetical protein